MKKVWNFWKLYEDRIEAYAWLLLAVPTLLWWKESVLWVALMSIYANYKTSDGAYKAEKAKREVRKSNGDDDGVD